MEKKFIGKICRALALFLLAGSSVTLAACKSNTTTKPSTNSTVTTAPGTETQGTGTTAGNITDNTTTNAPVVDAIELDKSALTVECYLQGAINATATGDVTFASSNEEVATIDENGVVTALSVGETVITATCGTASATCTVTVTETTVEPVVGANEEAITIKESGMEFTLTAETYWGGNRITEGIEYAWIIKEGEATDLITLNATGESLVVKGAKAGETVIVLASTVRGKTAYSEIEVTVQEDQLSVDILTNAGIIVSDKEGLNFESEIFMLDTETTKTSVEVVGTPTFGSEQVNASLVLTAVDSSIVSIENGTIKALKAGETTVKALYTYEDEIRGNKTAEFIIAVKVSRVSVSLNEHFVIETSNVKALTIASDIEGTVEGFTVSGKEVLASYSDKVITIDSNKLPKKVEEGMGDNCVAAILTSKVEYTFTVDLYTKIIMNKADLDNMGTLASQAANDNKITWDGYFVLGADIDYNGIYPGMLGEVNVWASVDGASTNADTYLVRGFKGVFDGKGYNIDSMTVKSNAVVNEPWGFIPTLMEAGVIKNVSFTNAKCDGTSFISSNFAGTLENVMIEFTYINSTSLHGSGPTGGAVACHKNSENSVIRNCYFDAGHAEIIGTIEMLGVGNRYSKTYYTVENAFIVAPSAHENGSVYQTYEALIADSKAQEALATFSNTWTIVGGLPVFGNLINSTPLAIVNEPTESISVGDTFILEFNKGLIIVTVTKDGKATDVKYANGQVTIPDGVDYAGNYTLTAKSIYGTDTVTYNFTVEYVKNTTINTTIDFNFNSSGISALQSGIILDLSTAGDNLGTIKSVKIGDEEVGANCTLEGASITIPFAIFENGKMYGEKTIVVKSNLGSAEFTTTINALLVTKIINSKTDLDNMGAIAKAFSNDGGNTWDGYFALGSNIEYNGVYPGMFGTENVWTTAGNIDNSATRGFKGVFDGRSFVIDGLKIVKNTASGAGSGFIPTVMVGGLIKNAIFTNAEVTDCGFICSNVAASTENQFYNIYIQYKRFIGQNADTATFCPTNNASGKGQYVILDCRYLEEYVNSTNNWARARIGSRNDFIANNQRLFVVGNDLLVKEDGASKTGESLNFLARNEEEFKSEWKFYNWLKEYPTDFWDVSTKVPMPKALIK